MTTNTGGPAFPLIGTHEQVLEIGLTMRDYFAGKYIAGAAADPNLTWNDESIKLITTLAYKVADAMLKAREVFKENPNGL